MLTTRLSAKHGDVSPDEPHDDGPCRCGLDHNAENYRVNLAVLASRIP